jgi:glycosyltransferase involved in cell wall biosynthesis
MRPGLVRVLLSTYNSADFVRPLLDSVLDQTHAPLELWVRDDGSRDTTPKILAEYAQRFPGRIRVDPGANVGMVHSYFTLLRDAGRDAEFTAFADHDDVWHADKIARAVAMLRSCGEGGPLMYTGRLHIVDERMRHLANSLVPTRPLSFRNALVENVAAACTMVMNPTARDLLLEQRDLSGIVYPDWWFYLVVSAFGTVLYDTHMAVDYRRHGRNAVGSPTGLRRLVEAWRLVRRGAYPSQLRAQARALDREFSERLAPSVLATLHDFLALPPSFAGRTWHALTCGVYRQRRLDGVLVRVLLATAQDHR